MTTAPPEAGSRTNNIDAIRLFLAVLVLFSHCYPLANGPAHSGEPLARFSGGQMTLGGLAVRCFFILSGFLIAQSWDRSRGTRSYLEKRVRRIFPGFIAASAFGLWVVGPLAGASGMYSPRAVAKFFRSVALLSVTYNPDAFAAAPIPGQVNGSLWTIRYEFLCYLGVLALGLAGLFGRRRWILGLYLVAEAVSLATLYLGLDSDGRLPFMVASCIEFAPRFLIGMVAYLYRDRLDFRRGPAALVAAVALVAATQVPFALLLLFPLAGTYLLFYLAFAGRLHWQGAARHGDFSYGVYLYAFPIQQLIVYWAGRPIDPLALFALALPPTMLAGILSWHLIENPFLRRARRSTEAAPRPVPVPAEPASLVLREN